MVSKLVCMMLWVVFLLGGWCWCACDACWDEEKTALLKLKPFFESSIEGANNWGEKGSNCCEWEKVECNSSTGRVIRLYLNLTATVEPASDYFYFYSFYGEDQRGKQWYLNVSLFHPFEELQSLYLSGNFIAGFLDHQGFKKKLEKLEVLDLSDSYFNDTILASLSELPSLKYLYLRNNQFDGSNLNDGFEKISRKLEKLEILDLSRNYFNDSIFASLSELTSLKSLYLGNNQFDGSNPNDGIKRLSKLKNLETLYLNRNFMFGNSIVSNLCNFTSLRSLSLQKCGLQGTLQMQEFNNLVNLTELDLSDNYEIESLGSSFQGDELRLKKLEVLGLRGNNFDNSIFSTLASLPNLKSLDISDNRLEGPIRIKDINALSSLEELYMVRNQVNEFVPSQGNERLMNLKALYLWGNLFNNSILTSLGNLSNLKSLGLGGTKFRGSIDLTELNVSIHLEDLSLHCDLEYSLVTEVGKDDSSSCSLELQSLGLFPSLKTLYLGGFTSIQGPIIMTSQKLNSLTRLEHLSLDCQLGERSNCSFELQSPALFPALKTLYLSGFTSSEGSILMTPRNDKSHNFSNLEKLVVRDSLLQTNFLRSIGQFTSLKCLVISFCRFNGTLQGICELGNLKELDLSGNDLKGSLPECFFNLTSLQSLDVAYNQLSGNISAFGSLASLQVLSLSDNNFQIPISLAPLFNLSKLQSLAVSNNIISADTQMHSLGAPAFQLQEIVLSSCGDVGSFPEFLYHQHDLVIIYLSNTYFKGNQFPIWLLENNTRLEELYLTNTSLSGPLQLPLSSLMRLRYLDISNNLFNGSIPMEIGEQLPSLNDLNMSNNHFTGSIPSSFVDMISIDLSNNQLSGRIPEHLAMSNPSLLVLALSNNKLEGKVFSQNFNFTRLTDLLLDGNNFSGKISDVLSKSPSLIRLDVSNNHLSGRIPRWMGNMSSLEKIIISDNNLQGRIPVEICQLHDLILLDLSVNNITGTLPSCFSPSQIKQVHLSQNRLGGTLPSALRNSSTLVTLDISHNFFTGTIPSWIGGLSNLSYLLLGNNNFQGQIPMELCNLNDLSLIDLSHNNLSGRIPPCLKITTLEDEPEDFVDGLMAFGPAQFSLNEPITFPIKNVSNSYKGKIISLVSGIDLSCNKLVGEIPYEFGNFYKIIVLNLSHNSLTGPIPPTFAKLKQIESLDLSYNKLSGNIPPQLVGLNFLAFFIVSFNNLSGKTPPRVAQFGIFDESSYRGNPFLCGEPLPKCTDSGPSSPMPNSSTDGDEDDGLIDMGVFRVSFIVSYGVMVLTVAVVLYINPYWRRAWFYHVETTASACYYFVIDNFLPRRFHC